MPQSATSKFYSLKEAKKKFGLSVRKLSFLIRNDMISAVVENGRLLIPEDEIRKYLGLPKNKRKSVHTNYLKTLGPGLITGASDDDPSGIGTYSTVGSAYYLSLTWLALYLLPMMTAVQETVARIGIISGKGLSQVIGKYYGKKVLYPLVLMLLIANTINIGADIGAMVAAFQLLYPINFYFGAVILTLFMLFLVINFPYHKYSKILKWLTISLLGYIITGFIIHPDWLEVGKSLVFPRIQFSLGYLAAMVAVMGTTISPYLFFWQASEEVEEKQDKGTMAEHHVLALRKEIREMRKDTFTGMAFANVVFLFIIVTTAFVLNKNGITTINSAAEAASALKPLAGDMAYLLFAVGIFGVGLLSVPVLAGASAYGLAELFHWHEGLSRRYKQARGFYDIIIVSMIVGLLLNFFGINPIRALYYAAIVNGFAAPVLMFFIFKIGSNKKVMGEFTSPKWVLFWGWFATILMGVSSIALIIFVGLGK